MSFLQRLQLRPHCTVQATSHTPPHQQLSSRHLPPRPSLRCSCSAGDASADPIEAPLATEVDQPASITIPAPLGPTEPANEEPKKLSPNARLSENLNSTSITIVGDDTELIWAVCQALSKKIGWFPVATSKVLLGLHKAGSIQEYIDKHGHEALVQAEADVLKGMKGQFRCCVATIGNGAAAERDIYPNLYGTIIIWLDEQDKRNPKPQSPARQLYHDVSEVRAVLQKSGGGFGSNELSFDEKVTKATSQLIKAMNQLLKEHDYLPAKKRLYVEMGCRGDWPQLKPEDWNPVVEGLDRKPVPEV